MMHRGTPEMFRVYALMYTQRRCSLAPPLTYLPCHLQEPWEGTADGAATQSASQEEDDKEPTREHQVYMHAKSSGCLADHMTN